jgi:hypothetical protein
VSAANNVVSFPKFNQRTTDLETAKPIDPLLVYKDAEAAEAATKIFADQSSLDIAYFALVQMCLVGLGRLGPNDIPDVLMLIETLRSIMYKSQGMDHPLHEFSAEIFEDTSPELGSMVMDLINRSKATI